MNDAGFRNVLLICTGGTITMTVDPGTGSLAPFRFEQLYRQIPELNKFDFRIDYVPFHPLLDSSEIGPAEWIRMAETIYEAYDRYDGFVVLHGTDTMAYSASALSFMLQHLQKPVIFTGSQLPIGMVRTDGKENLITAIEIAAAAEDGHPIVPEVCIFFENTLWRGNRTTKKNAELFNAFGSYNYAPLATAGVRIRYNRSVIHYERGDEPLTLHKALSTDIAILKLFPGISESYVNAIFQTKGLRAIVLESFGAGNAPSHDWLVHSLRDAGERGIVIVNVTQCNTGSVEMGRYKTSVHLHDAGVISGYDITTESAVTKLMFLLGHHQDPEKIKLEFRTSCCGEMTVE
jgi:L-asparaginase